MTDPISVWARQRLPEGVLYREGDEVRDVDGRLVGHVVKQHPPNLDGFVCVDVKIAPEHWDRIVGESPPTSFSVSYEPVPPSDDEREP